MARELVTREAFQAAINERQGVIVIFDYPEKTRTAHPIPCPQHVQLRHFVQKVIVNNCENGRYYLAGSFAEARRELDAEPCQNA